MYAHNWHYVSVLLTRVYFSLVVLRLPPHAPCESNWKRLNRGEPGELYHLCVTWRWGRYLMSKGWHRVCSRSAKSEKSDRSLVQALNSCQWDPREGMVVTLLKILAQAVRTKAATLMQVPCISTSLFMHAAVPVASDSFHSSSTRVKNMYRCGWREVLLGVYMVSTSLVGWILLTFFHVLTACPACSFIPLA